MNILVTGASGFVGRHLVKYLQQKKGLNIFSLGRTSINGIVHYQLDDLQDKSRIVDVIDGVRPDYVFHLAGTSQPSDLKEAILVNACFGINLLDAINIVGLSNTTKCLFFGSASEYGLIKEMSLPISERYCCMPYSYYGISKFAQTASVMSWSQSVCKTVVIRPFTMLGSNIPKSMAIGSFMDQINMITSSKDNCGILNTGNLDVYRDFLDVQDVVKICWKLANTDKAYGNIINMCSGKSINLRTILEYMIYVSGTNIKIEVSSDRIRKNDMKHHYGDNSLLMHLIGSFEFTDWRTSVKRMMEQR